MYIYFTGGILIKGSVGCYGKSKTCLHILRIAIGITMLALLMLGGAGAATITVNASGGGDFTGIQDAIDNASTGDTILVYRSIYYENVKITKQLNLRGIGNPEVDAGGSGSAITLAANGITLEGFTATGSAYTEAGIRVISSNNVLIGNNASNNGGAGISVRYSNNNTLSGNLMTGNQENFNLYGDSDSDFNNYIDPGNLVDGKPLYYIIKASDTTYDNSSNAGTLYCISCINVTIKDLNLNKNIYGIFFWNTSQSKIQDVNASYNGIGIYLSSSSNNTLSGNNASNNNYGIYLSSSSNNTLSGNMMTGNQENFNLIGDNDSDFDNNIGTSNLVDGGHIYYIIKASDTTYDNSSNAGTIYCISCLNVTIENLNLNKNSKGIYFRNTSRSIIQNVNVSNNKNGISLSYSSNNNTLSGNNASNNDYGICLSYSSNNNTLTGNNASNNNYGICLSYSSNNNTLTGNNASTNNYGISLSYSSNNKIYNNIFNNTKNVEFHNLFHDSKINTWNTTRQSGPNIIGGSFLGGNFWAIPEGTGFSQTCMDLNVDGICDNRNILDLKNIDYLPLAKDRIPPKRVSNLKNESYASSYINWTWTDPKEPDFVRVKIYINNIYRTSVMKGVQYYKAKNLYANRSYTISIRTVDISGNVNLAWKNNTARTKPDLVPPMNVTNLKNITYEKNYINWTWKDPKDNDFKKVMVFIDNKFKGNVSKGKRYYNASNFIANTEHTISTWTVDMNGNINKTWTKSSAWTSE